MSIRATSPSWNAVESASRRPKRSSAHSSTSRGSCPSNSTDSSPASSSSSSSHRRSCSSRASSSPALRRGLAGSRPITAPELVVGRAVAERPEASRRAARRSSQAATRRSTVSSSSSVGTRRKTGRPIAASGPSAAAQEDVVGLAALARPRRGRSCPGSRGRRPSAGAQACGQPSRCSRSSADLVAEALLEVLDQARRAASSSR